MKPLYEAGYIPFIHSAEIPASKTTELSEDTAADVKTVAQRYDMSFLQLGVSPSNHSKRRS
jgi:hypothetical protein